MPAAALLGVVAALTLSLQPLALTPALVYEVELVGDVMDLYQEYLLVFVEKRVGSFIWVNLTYIRGERVRVRDFEFIRPYRAVSVLVEVDTREWIAYYEGRRVGRFSFYRLPVRVGEPAFSTISVRGVVDWAVVDAALKCYVSENDTMVPAVELNFTFKPPRAPEILVKLKDVTGLQRLEIHRVVVNVEGRELVMSVEGLTGIPLFMSFWNFTGIRSAVLELLGIEGRHLFLSLIGVGAERPPVTVARRAPVDPRAPPPLGPARRVPI